jgi:diguanylate cyclase (GGDEF)-like protein
MQNSPSILPSDYINLSLWNEFQNNLSGLLETPLAIYDSNGSLIAPQSKEDSICEILKKRTRRGLELYKNSYIKAITKAIQRNEPYIYKCFTNQYVFVIPVILDPNLSVAIVGGRVYLSDDDFQEFIKGSADLGLDDLSARELQKTVRIIQPHDFFTKPHIVKSLAVPFLRSLYLKGFYEKGYYQMQTVIGTTAPAQLPDREEDIYRNVFSTLGVLFDVDTACIMGRCDKEDFNIRIAFGRNKDLLSRWPISDSTDIIERVVTTRRPGICDNIFDAQKMGLPEGITSAHIFPMVVRDNVSDFLCVFNTGLSKESVKLIALLANQLSIVLEGIRADQDIRQRFSNLNLLEGVYKTIAPVLEQEELYDTIINKSTELVGAGQGSLMILNEEDMTLAVKATKGIDKRILENLKIRIGEGISGKVVEKGTPLFTKDIESKPFSRKNRSRYKTGSFISLPLKMDSRTIGVINISDKITGEVFSENDLHLLLSFACYASIALERGTYYRMTEELKKISVTDSLTGLLNRRYFHERLFEEVERSKRHDEPFSIFIIDIDNFKSFNDRYGHLAGDEVLRRVAHATRDAVRSIDVVSRFGGEEFSVILPHTRKADSYIIAERIRRCVEDVRCIEGRIPSDQKISVCLGVAEFPYDADSIEELIENADRAMYLAKASGKNKVVGYGQ